MKDVLLARLAAAGGGRRGDDCRRHVGVALRARLLRVGNQSRHDRTPC
jgi:hypothetical protein